MVVAGRIPININGHTWYRVTGTSTGVQHSLQEIIDSGGEVPSAVITSFQSEARGKPENVWFKNKIKRRKKY